MYGRLFPRGARSAPETPVPRRWNVMRRPRAILPLPALVPLVGAAPSLSAQAVEAPPALTAADYERAERFLAPHTEPLVLRGEVDARWAPDGSAFWYRNRIEGGHEFVRVDPRAPSRERAFDHERLAAALGAVIGQPVAPLRIPIAELLLSDDELRLGLEDGRWVRCDADGDPCAPIEPPRRPARNEGLAPDGRHAAFLREHDLWVRDLATGEETRLTTDGEEDFGYATDNAGWTRSDRPVLRWSPDSRKIATFRHDSRGVGMMYVTSVNVGHPELDAWRYPLPGDSLIFRIHRVVVHLDRPEGQRVVPLDMEPDAHRSTVCDHVSCGGTFADVEWSADSERIVFVSS